VSEGLQVSHDHPVYGMETGTGDRLRKSRPIHSQTSSLWY
jgi:hypothetical protein